MTSLIVIYSIWNIIVFATMGIDKYKAVRNKWRISEKTLLMMAFVMGGVGAWLGSQAFHHKTQKLKFKILLPLFAGFNLAIIGFLLYKTVT